VMAVDAQWRITGFVEKPADPPPMPGDARQALASMGIYIFDAKFLHAELERDIGDAGSSHDFGKDIIPHLVREGHARAHPFRNSCVLTHAEDQPYWRDVGTIDAYWDANIDLTATLPMLDLYDTRWPIWTYQPQLPPAKFLFEEEGRSGVAYDSMVSGGSIVSGSTVRRSLLSINVHVHSYCTIEDSVVLPSVDVGRHSVIRRAIIDKECVLPEGFVVGVDPAKDRERYLVTEGGVVLVTPAMLA